MIVFGIGGLAMFAVGAVLWFANSGDDASSATIRTLGLALCILGAVDLVASVVITQVLRRRRRPAGYDGQPVTYTEGMPPPGML